MKCFNNVDEKSRKIVGVFFFVEDRIFLYNEEWGLVKKIIRFNDKKNFYKKFWKK